MSRQAKATLVTAIAILGLAAPAAARGHFWRTYVNARYGYSLCYPADLFRPGPEPEAGDGIVFRGAHGETLIAEASYNSDSAASAAAAEAEFKAVTRGAVAYRAARADWAVASGSDGRNLVYVRQAQRGDVLAGFELIYPASEKAALDSVVVQLNGCLGLAPVAASAEPASANADDPRDVVTALIALDVDGAASDNFAATPNAFMRRRFTDEFNAAWANAMSHNADEPVLDGDPITGEQGVAKVALQNTRVAEGGDFAGVVAQLLITSEGQSEPHPESLAFVLRREGNAWKVDDISATDMPSLRTYFRKSYGK